MWKLTKQTATVLTLCLITLSMSCASLDLQLPPTLANRSLEIDKRPGKFGFEYTYKECVKSLPLLGCRRYETRVDYYDLTDPVMKKQLIDMGFVLKVREKKS